MSSTGTLTASKGNSGIVNHRRHSDSVLTTYENDSSARSTCYEWRSQRMRSVPFVRRVVDRALDASRRKRDGMIGQDGNGGGRGSEERIERERMRGRGERKLSRGEVREERDDQWRVPSIRQRSEAAAGLGVDLSRRSLVTRPASMIVGVAAFTRHSRESWVSWSPSRCCSRWCFVQERATKKRLPLTAMVGRRRRKRAAPGSTSRRRRHAASLCARLRPGTSHVNVVWVLTTAHTNACTLWMHGGYIKSGWIYRGDREGRLLITRRVDQPLSLRLSSSFLSLPSSLC